MVLEETAGLIRSLKKHQITFTDPGFAKVDYNKEAIYSLIPHRPPFNLVDRICAISLSEKMIQAERTIPEDDPIFEGHFPGQAVYPGVFQIEMMGQVGLCLSGFILRQSVDINAVEPIKALFTRVHNAGFIEQVLPGDHLEIFAQLVEFDEFLGVVAAQIVKENKIIAHSISEVYFL